MSCSLYVSPQIKALLSGDGKVPGDGLVRWLGKRNSHEVLGAGADLVSGLCPPLLLAALLMLTPAQLPSPGPHREAVSVPLRGLASSQLVRPSSLPPSSLLASRLGLGWSAGGEGEGVASAGRLLVRRGRGWRGGAGEGVLLSVLSWGRSEVLSLLLLSPRTTVS